MNAVISCASSRSPCLLLFQILKTKEWILILFITENEKMILMLGNLSKKQILRLAPLVIEKMYYNTNMVQYYNGKFNINI